MTELDHIGIVVKDLEKSLNVYRTVYGLNDVTITTFEKMELRIAVVKTGGADIHLLSPLELGSGMLGKYLQEKGEGIHHIGMIVDNLESVTGKLTECCMEPSIQRFAPKESGITNMKVAMASSSSLQDILTELVEILDVSAGSGEKS